MPEGKTVVAYALSFAAFLGPVAFIFFGFHEMGRLGYFGAPNDFMQLSSFGVMPVVITVYPAMFITFLVVGILSGLRYASPSHQLVLVVVAFTYVSMVLLYLSLTPTWKWVFGVSTAIGVVAAVALKRNAVEIGNEAPKNKPLPEPVAVNYLRKLQTYILVSSGAVFIPLFFSAAGVKVAATQEYYWVSGGEVVLGFYGDQALMGALNGDEVGPTFRFAELKSIPATLKLQRIGPLRSAPMWKPESR